LNVVEVQPVRLRIDLQAAAAVVHRGKAALEVERDRVMPPKQAAARMRQNADMRPLQALQQPLGLH
jgi:hypothetical protein